MGSFEGEFVGESVGLEVGSFVVVVANVGVAVGTDAHSSTAPHG